MFRKRIRRLVLFVSFFESRKNFVSELFKNRMKTTQRVKLKRFVEQLKGGLIVVMATDERLSIDSEEEKVIR